MTEHKPTGFSVPDDDWDEPFDDAAGDATEPSPVLDGTVDRLLLTLAETVIPAYLAIDLPRVAATQAPKWADLEPGVTPEGTQTEPREVAHLLESHQRQLEELKSKVDELERVQREAADLYAR